MTQRISFTQKMIVEAAFALTREEGWGGVTARSIARKLGSSTMPIYSSLKSMREIEAAVRVRAESLMREFQGRVYTNEQPLDIALGYVSFARDERNLFRFLYVDRPLPGRAQSPPARGGTAAGEGEIRGNRGAHYRSGPRGKAGSRHFEKLDLHPRSRLDDLERRA